MKHSRLLWIAGLLMLGGLLVAMFGCASFRIGTDDHAYIGMIKIHRERCPDPPFVTGSVCDQESSALSAYRDAIQAYSDAVQTPGAEPYQKARLDKARAAARKLFPTP